MQHSNEHHDLNFTTSVDESVKQNVPIPPPTNNALSSMMSPMSMSAGDCPASPTSPSYTPTLPGLSFLNQSAHPTTCLFHILFKALAFTIYMLGSRFGMEDIMITVICIILNAADFWTVKNITGRLLVGLRWWNKVDPVTGATNWIFECANPNAKAVSNFDSKFFWAILYLTPVLWMLCFVSAILWFRFQCFVTLSCALVLSASNVYGYYQCSKDQKQQMQEWMNTGAEMGVRAMARNGMFGWMGGMFGGGAGGRQAVPQHDTSGTFA